MEAIVTYSESPLELLKRRKLKRDALFQYLASEEIVVSINSEKHVLAERILKHWGSACPEQAQLAVVGESLNYL